MALEVIGSTPDKIATGKQLVTGRAYKKTTSSASFVGYNLGFMSSNIFIANDTSGQPLEFAFTDSEVAPSAAHGEISGNASLLMEHRIEQYVWIRHTGTQVTFRLMAW